MTSLITFSSFCTALIATSQGGERRSLAIPMSVDYLALNCVSLVCLLLSRESTACLPPPPIAPPHGATLLRLLWRPPLVEADGERHVHSNQIEANLFTRLEGIAIIQQGLMRCSITRSGRLVLRFGRKPEEETATPAFRPHTTRPTRGGGRSCSRLRPR